MSLLSDLATLINLSKPHYEQARLDQAAAKEHRVAGHQAYTELLQAQNAENELGQTAYKNEVEANARREGRAKEIGTYLNGEAPGGYDGAWYTTAASPDSALLRTRQSAGPTQLASLAESGYGGAAAGTTYAKNMDDAAVKLGSMNNVASIPYLTDAGKNDAVEKNYGTALKTAVLNDAAARRVAGNEAAPIESYRHNVNYSTQANPIGPIQATMLDHRDLAQIAPALKNDDVLLQIRNMSGGDDAVSAAMTSQIGYTIKNYAKQMNIPEDTLANLVADDPKLFADMYKQTITGSESQAVRAAVDHEKIPLYDRISQHQYKQKHLPQ